MLPPDAGQAGFSIDYRKLLTTAKKYFWLIILFLISGVVAAVVWLNNQIPIYESIAQVKVEQRVMETSPSMGGGGDIGESLQGLEMLQTIQLGFKSRSLAQRIAEKMDLKNRKDFIADTRLKEAVSDDAFTGYLLANSRAELIQGTRLITVSFDHPDPKVAQEMTDAFIREYIALEGEQRLGAASVNLSYLIEEKRTLEGKLKKSEEDLTGYTRKLGSVSVDGELNLIAEQLQALNTQLTATKTERLRLENDLAQIRRVKDNPQALLEVGSIAQLGEISNLRSQLNSLDVEISRLRERYGSKNPQLVQLESQREAVQKALFAEALRAPQTVELAMQSAQQNEKSMEQAVAAQEKKVIDVKDLSIQANVLQRQIDADKMAYQAVLQRLNEETSQARSQPVFIQVVDSAGPAYKVSPKPLQAFAIAVFISLALSGATVFLLAYLDSSFKSVDEVEAVLGVPVLAAIPRFDEKKRKKQSGETEEQDLSKLPLLEDPFSFASESYRTLRTGVLMHEDENHTILMTSAAPEEGKSTNSINLAISMAQHGSRTLLIDCDLRKPTIGKRLTGRSDQNGLAELLTESVEFENVLVESSVENLFILPAGKVSKHSGELLLRRRHFERVLKKAREQFDHVIVDSAPLLAVSDTLAIARYFKTICMVVRSHKTPRRMTKRAIDLLKRAHRAPTGVIFGIVPPEESYYNYGYSYGGKGYGERSA